ncbi:19544_t:CDS:2, partial [Entrophospora sp. SA101]
EQKEHAEESGDGYIDIKVLKSHRRDIKVMIISVFGNKISELSIHLVVEVPVPTFNQFLAMFQKTDINKFWNLEVP